MDTPQTTQATVPEVKTSGNPVGDNKAPQGNTFAIPEDIPEDVLEQQLANRKFTRKINGKEVTKTYAEWKKVDSIGHAADDKFKTASQLKAEAETVKKALESGDVVSALKKAGKSDKEVRQLLEDHLVKLIEEENIDPKDKELRELKAFKEQQEREAKEKEEQENLTKEQQEIKQLQNQYEQDLVNAMKKTNLPNNALTYKMVAQEVYSAYENGVQLSFEDAARIVEQEVTEQLSTLLPQLGLDRVKKLLGADVLKALQEESVKQVKQSSPFPTPSPRKESKQAAKSEEPQKMSMQEYFNSLRQAK